VGLLIGCSKAGFGEISEVKPGDRIYGIERSTTSSEAMVGGQGDPEPDRWKVTGERLKAKEPKRVKAVESDRALKVKECEAIPPVYYQ